MNRNERFDRLKQGWRERSQRALNGQDEYTRQRVVLQTTQDSYFDAFRVQTLDQEASTQYPYFVLLGSAFKPDLNAIALEKARRSRSNLRIKSYRIPDTNQAVPLPVGAVTIPVKSGAVLKAHQDSPTPKRKQTYQDSPTPKRKRRRAAEPRSSKRKRSQGDNLPGPQNKQSRLTSKQGAKALEAVACSCPDFQMCAAPHTAPSPLQRKINFGATYGCKHMMMINLIELDVPALPRVFPDPYVSSSF